MTSNEQKLRAAAVLMTDVNDTIEELTELRDAMLRMRAYQHSDGVLALNMVKVLIETHPENKA